MNDLDAINTGDAPAAIGPYAQAVVSDGWIHTSGQIPLDPLTGDVVAGGITEQTTRVLANLGAVLEAAGGGADTVLKTTVYLTDLTEFAAMNEVYARFFGEHRPARTTVQVAGLPRGVRVEIDAIGRARSSGG